MPNSLDVLLKSLKQPGLYLTTVYTIVCFNYIPIVFNHLAMAFYGAKTVYQCATNNSNTLFETNKCEGKDLLLNVTVKCSQVQYFVKYPKRTIRHEWDLICDKAYLSPLATTIYFLGVMFGGVVFGFFADYIGRKRVMLLTLFLSVPVGAITSVMPVYEGFAIFRFVQGALMQGLQATSYVLLMELSVTRNRVFLCELFEVFWSIGLMSLAGICYLIQDWRYIQLAISLPSLICIPYIWLIPESPRWLLLKNRKQEALAVFEKMSRWNNTALNKDLWLDYIQQFDLQTTTIFNEKKYTALDLCKTPKLKRHSLLLFYIWFVTAVAYYGLNLSITDLAGNKYLNFFIGAAVELPAYLASIYILNRFGRKRPLFCYFLFSGLACISAGVLSSISRTETRTAATVLAMIGKFNMAGTFSVIFLYASEIYPTVMRNTGLGMCAVFLRFGGVLAPQILLLRQYTSPWVPIVIFGSLSIVAAGVTLLLPETQNVMLPDTVHQSEKHRHVANDVDLTVEMKKSPTNEEDIPLDMENTDL